MKDTFSGSVPFRLFLNTFHPVSADPPPLPKLIFNITLPCEENVRGAKKTGYHWGKYMVSDVCRAINTSGVCPSIEFVNAEYVYIHMNGTLAGDDPQNKLKVTASGMQKVLKADKGQNSKDGKNSLSIIPDWESMRVTMEFKVEEEDPVVDQEPKVGEAQRKQEGAVHQTDKASLARGQASTYVLHQFSLQNRTSVTSIMILGRWARLLRYDHAGVVVSERFDWRANDGELLADFLSRLEHGTPQEEGIDDSVGDLSAFGGDESEVVKEARKAMQEFSAGMIDVPIDDKAPLRTVECWDDSQLGDDGLPTSRTLIATKPLGLNFSIVGRYTVSFIGYDVEKRCAYWVKDSWPINNSEFTREGQIYERLNAAGVPHLAAIECAGEVRWKTDKAVQRTRTDEFVKEGWSGLTANIHPLSHYRILFKDIGRPVSKFESTQQLVTALSHAVKAHSVAYEKAHVLHRDISPGNILINRKGDGMLIDWDLSLLYDNVMKDITDRKPRMLWRTGTWAFLSIALLKEPFSKTHELSDDLESFFWVLLYVVLRYRYGPTKWLGPASDSDFQTYMLELFESKMTVSDGITVGGKEKRNFLAETHDHLSCLELALMKDASDKAIPPPLSDLVVTLRRELHKFYNTVKASEDAENDAAVAAALAAAAADEDEEDESESESGDSEGHDDEGEDDALPQPPLPPQVAQSTPLPLPKSRGATTVFDTSTYLAARFDAAVVAKWPRRKIPDSSIDRFPYIHLPTQTCQSLEEEGAPIYGTRSDNPEQRRARTRPSRDEAAEDARVRAGGDFMIIPLSGRSQSPRGQKRARESTLDPIPEEREPKAARYDEQTLTLKRLDAGPPNEVLIRDNEGNYVKDVKGRLMCKEAWSAPSLRF